MHELGGRVVAALAGCTQIQLKIGNEHRGYFFYGYIRKMVLALDELGKMPFSHFVFLISGFCFGNTYQLLHIVIVFLKQGKDGFMVVAVSQKLVLHLFSSNIVITPLHFMINGIQ